LCGVREFEFKGQAGANVISKVKNATLYGRGAKFLLIFRFLFIVALLLKV
jgi:hypothetical protein